MHKSRLLVLIPDHLSDILAKGEIQPRYYNPGEVFDEVHILMTNADRPERGAVQYMVGRAEVHLHNLPEDPYLIARRWNWPGHVLLKRWAAPGVELARQIRPQLMRCHGADWNIYLASRIKRVLGIPYVVSLHINPDVNSPRRYLGAGLTPAQARHNRFFEYFERTGLRAADLVMPVYEPIVPYLERMGVRRHEVCYNVLNGDRLRRKDDYRLGETVRAVCVGRLFDDKDPSNIVRALADLPRLHLTIVGDGPKRPALEALVAELGLSAQVEFRPSVVNDELCRSLADYDLFVVHTEYWELNKSVLEALLTGLPVVINRRRGEPVPELAAADITCMVDNTVESYREALATLIADDGAREALGRRAYAHAQAHWGPAQTEAKYASIYRALRLGGGAA